MIEAFKAILRKSETPKQLDFTGLFRTIVNIGVCEVYKFLSKKLSKVVYSCIHSRLSPQTILNFIEAELNEKGGSLKEELETAYSQFWKTIEGHLDVTHCRTIAFVLKVLPVRFCQNEEMVRYLKSQLKE